MVAIKIFTNVFKDCHIFVDVLIIVINVTTLLINTWEKDII